MRIRKLVLQWASSSGIIPCDARNKVAKKARNHIYCAILLVLRLEFEFKTKMKIVFICLILILGQDLTEAARRPPFSPCSDGHEYCTLKPRKVGECCPIGKCQIG